MFTKRAKAYSSSCSQTVSLSPAISSQFILGLCLAAKIANINKKILILEIQGLSQSSMLIRLKSSSVILLVICSMFMPICNRFYERLANNSKITTLRRYRSLMSSCAGFLEPRKLGLGPSKSTFNAKNFTRSFSMFISIDFGAIRA